MVSISDKYIGKKYGNWTISGIDNSNKDVFHKDVFHNYVFATCVCGAKETLLLNALISGQTTGCGCNKKQVQIKTRKQRPSKNRVGETYGEFMIARMLPQRKGFQQEFICVCENGHEILIDSRDFSIKNEKHRTCWCHQTNLLKKTRLKLGYSLRDVSFLSGTSTTSVNIAETNPKRSTRSISAIVANGLDISIKETEAYLDDYFPMG